MNHNKIRGEYWQLARKHSTFIRLIPDVQWLDQILSLVCEPPKFRNEELCKGVRTMTSKRRHLKSFSRDVCRLLKQFRFRRNFRASLLCNGHVDWRHEHRKVSHPNVNINMLPSRKHHRRLMDRSNLSKKSYYSERVCLLIPELCEGTILITNSNETQQLHESSRNPSSTPSILSSTEKPNLMHSSSVSQMPTKLPKQQPTPPFHPQFTFPVEITKPNIPTTQLQSFIPSVMPNSAVDPSSTSYDTPIFYSQSPTFKDSLTQSSVAPSYPRNSRSCPMWRDSTKDERVQVAIVEFKYTVQITSLVATFLPDMEDLILQVAADQTLNCQSQGIVRLSYTDPGSSLSICSPSIPEAQTCWNAISTIRIYYDESNISHETARQNVWNAIREEFDFGDRIKAIIPNQVQVELWETTNAQSTKHGWGRGDPSRLSVGASIGIVILLWTIIWAAGATIKVQLWRSSNKQRLPRRKNRSFRQTPDYHYYSNSLFMQRNLMFGSISKKSRHDIYHDNDKDEEQDWMVSDDEEDYEEENSDDYEYDNDDDDRKLFLGQGEYASNIIES